MRVILCTIAVAAWFSQSAASPMINAKRVMAANGSVVICCIDAATTHHMSCYGYSRKTTPVIDRLAREGIFFKNAFSQACYTVSSTGSLMTGLYPEHHETYAKGPGLPESFTTLAEVMKANGCVTAMFSGNGFANGDYGYAQGFDHYDDLTGDWRSRTTPWLNGREANEQEKITAWLEQNRKGRIFAYIHIIPPHENYEPPSKFHGRWARVYPGAPRTDAVTLMAMQQGKRPYTEQDRQYVADCYDENMLYADYNVGLLIDTLKKAGRWDSTLFILLSDHGEAFAEHHDFLHNTTLYDEMIHVPMIFKFPKGVGPGPKVIDGLAESVDILPTVAELCGATPPAMDGVSLVPLISGEKAEIKERTFSRTAHGIIPTLSVRDKRYKYTFSFRTDKRELYDLTSDPSEKVNLVAERPLVARHMHGLLNHRIGYYQNKIAERDRENASQKASAGDR